jgi:hypothetical protein
MIGDFYKDKWRDFPYTPTNPINPYPNIPDNSEEIEKLRKEVKQMKELLKRAVKYDKENNQPHCETEDKIKFLKQVAEFVGVDLEDVLNAESN